jgi:hypothetical protein
VAIIAQTSIATCEHTVQSGSPVVCHFAAQPALSKAATLIQFDIYISKAVDSYMDAM